MSTREKKFHAIIDLENVNGDDAEGNVKRKADTKGLPPELLTAISKLPKKSLALSLHGPLPHRDQDPSPYVRKSITTSQFPAARSSSINMAPNIALFQKISFSSTSAVTSLRTHTESKNCTKIICTDL